MLKRVFVLVAVLSSLISFSQNIEKNLQNWSLINPIEKVYVHTDRESYTSGQTIWLKAYFLSEYVPSSKSTALYLELLNTSGQIVVRKVFPAFMSESYGQLDLPEDLVSGTYLLRAYSPIMLNQPGFYYTRKLNIFGSAPKQPSKKAPASALNISFFPEGGNLMERLMNNVAFKAVDEDGLPVNLSIELRNQKEEVITTATAIHDGMGRFALVPQPGELYYAVITHNGETKKFALPAATTRGVALSVRDAPKGKAFRIEQLQENETFKAAYMIGQMQNSQVFQVNVPSGKNQFGGTIETSQLLSGILQITVFNKDNMPLAERLVFIDNKEYILPATLAVDTLNTDERKRNHYSIMLKDTVIGKFSISITDADYETAEMRSQNIYSYFLLNSDLKGYIHNPAWYFGNDQKASSALDLVMATNGWTRFKWEDAINNTLPNPNYKDMGLISLKGRVNIEGTKKILANKDLVYFIAPSDTSRRKFGMPHFFKTDSAGRFAIDSQVFFDRNNVLFSDINGKKSKFIKVKLDQDSLYRPFSVPAFDIPHKDSMNEASVAKMTDAYNDYLKAEGVMLGNVTVRTRVKSKTEQLEETYTSGLFSGGINSRVLDLTNEVAGSMNIFDYLQGRMAGLSVSRNNEGSYTLSYRGGGMGGNNVALFLDEVPTDPTFIESIPVNQIAFVKLMGNFVGTSGGGAALAIYMKKGADLSAVTESATDIIAYNGYAVMKEFYSPNYDVRKPEDAKADNRLTLLWTPIQYVADVNGKIPVIFYNNDRTKKFKIVAEGVTNDGRFLMMEKIVNP